MKTQDNYMTGNIISYQYYSDMQMLAKVKEIRTHDFLVETSDGRKLQAADWCTKGVILLHKYFKYFDLPYDLESNSYKHRNKDFAVGYETEKKKKKFYVEFITYHGEEGYTTNRVYIKYVHSLQNLLTIIEERKEVNLKEFRKL